jgi:RNA polymerase sigma factor (sigma-70 family)
MSETDLELLKRYTRVRAEDAFTELVRRHVDLVHTAALRQVHSRQLAEEVAQSTFIKLARLAPQLASDTILTAWLYQVTRREAIDVVRREARRQLREQVATEMNTMNANTADWTHIEPLLDEAMHALDETDRAAVLLRYFENKTLREVGATLGTSDDAAQKRVSRAVERLREFFAKRNVTVGASGLVVVISANAVQAAPVGLAITISTAAALAGTALATAATATATKAIAMTTLQKTLITVTIAAAVGTGIYEARQASTLRTQVQTLQQQQTPLAEQIHQLQRERDEAKNRLATLADAIANSKGNSTELLKLRGEVTRLRADARELAQLKAADTQKDNDPMESAAKALLGKMKLLKQRLEQMPDKNIPELQYLDYANTARIAQNARLDTDVGVREAMSSLRYAAKQDFAPQMGQALQKYVQANNGQLPTDVSQLKPYFKAPVDDATLARYQMIRTGNAGGLQPDEMIVAEKAAVDDEYDILFQIGLYGQRSQGVGKEAGQSGRASFGNL